ncbi:hypothetical protein V8E55_006153, partial [Tylopilus felleus]
MSGPCWMTRLYNCISPKHSEWRHDYPAPTNMASSHSSFYHDELSCALSEQSFGLTRFEVSREYSEHEATAVVTLLEGTNITISLTIRGYRVNLQHFYDGRD